MNFTEIRHQLHSIAEISGCETKTSAFIVDKLKETKPTKILKFSNGNHILAEFSFGNDGKIVLFRADMDAIKVDEAIDLTYHSKNDGVSHKCGHDGHCTILLKLAEMLHQNPLNRGKILLLFQGAEETGKGAIEILKESLLDDYEIERVYALHNIPGEEKNAIICKLGSFTCSVISCEIILLGKTSHAAEPWNSVSPYDAAQAITKKISSYNNHDILSSDFCITTLIEFRVGRESYGVAAGQGILRFTIRTTVDKKLLNIKKDIEEIVKQETKKTMGLKSEISWLEYFAASNNSETAVSRVKESAESLGIKYVEKKNPFFWGEDFGLFTQHYNGALFGLGSGTEQPPLHHPDYDFPDDIIESGANMFYELAKREQI